MKRITLAIVLVLAAAAAYAQNVTQSVLEAKPVKKFIRVQLLKDPNDTTGTKTKVLNYAIDSYSIDDMKPLDGVSFRVDSPVLLLLANHNPLLELYDVKQKRTPDPNHEALKAFMDEIKTLQAALPDSDKPTAGGGTPETAEARRTRIAKKCLTDAACISDEENKEACLLFKSLIDDALDELKQAELKPKAFAQAVNNAHGQMGVVALRALLETARSNIAADNKKVQDDLTQISTQFGPQPNNAPPPRSCDQITSLSLISYAELVGKAEAIMARKEEFSRQIDKLDKSLEVYAVEDNWRGPSGAPRSDYVASSIKPTDEEEVDVTISVTLQQLEADAANTTITTSAVKDSQSSAAFPVRLDSYFTIERAMAVIYNRIKYPQYGTGPNAAGATVVKKKDDHQPINAAVMFNFIPRLHSISSVYPMFQIGFSSAKDFPGILAGVGVRMVGRFAVSLSAGGMITRYKDLDGKLKPEDPVSGTAEINDHLVYKTSPVALYGAIQVKF